MIIEVNVEDCYGFADADNLPENQPSGEIAAQTWENWFSVWLENQQADVPEAPGYEVSLRLTADADIQALNAQYRQQDRSTDVLAFAALEVDCPQREEMQSSEPLYLGDIIISIDTAKRQAQQQGHSLKTELAWLASHGFLHLLGWDHPDEESLTQMLDRQETLLRAIGLEIQTA
ncbi:MAG: rRNA maturation RNase YbeY [Microcoleus sp. PH2017_29_MFU_D_A]|jgi:probable rRNA maturation factor|uniref:rRNA maturation RNase YbeY n=1 Tax=unclassified Microcoleus TaxID=2642155 RepID=UPI001D68585F|nr:MULTISPECIES: rRNA maturation RNase YbeY [unclassified Microcoleus]MCC3419957.1 rRNA maturation RNase YbeY [Microcoleus sp. PH2017_07_MST_O_A]MCC3429813.1 rRNA maturation RNase YbeY [Microcoleus sp. PH2017_04_SCI_O_A]MCC3441921.1 rRNA maturation RNase YbeY [Microcoleus sp. PH2017_03_ELD_O_A]MCC3464575.1 rRNA maturation RNase YbeY [Microcoleus sp. PH2017_06_SFM_O_A]MCC3503077.1 rRNA maturation RNase YbeY [Microcoleus sp. PH2017_19_SFW_U_A]MCC3510118.1 rRNA maturation RNase YbeY [Microcoleus